MTRTITTAMSALDRWTAGTTFSRIPSGARVLMTPRLLAVVLVILAAVLAACSTPEAVASPELDPSSSTLSSPQVSTALGAPFVVTVQLRDADGEPFRRAGQQVTFVASSGGLSPASLDDGWVSTETAETDEEGRASVTLTPSGPGTVTVQAYVGETASGPSLGTVSITVVASAVEVDDLTVVYDGTPHSVTPRFYPPEAGDDATIAFSVDGASMENAPVDAGTYLVTVTVGGAYDATATATLNIEPRRLAVDDVAWSGKAYDGTTDAFATAAILDTQNVVEGDDVRIADVLDGSFASRNAGTHAVGGRFALTGAQGTNYRVDPQPTGMATITAATVSLVDAAVAAKTYDGTTSATVTGSLSAEFAPNDDVTLAGTFATADVGMDVAVAVELIGDDAGNYALDVGDLTGAIEPRALVLRPEAIVVEHGEALPSDALFTAEGLVEGEAIASVDLTVDGAEAPYAVGRYDLRVEHAVPAKGTDLANYAVETPALAAGLMVVDASTTFAHLADATFAYDGTPKALTPEFVPAEAEEGATVTYEDASGTIEYEAPSDVGSYTVTANAGPGYEGSATATLVIEPITLSVEDVEFASKVYDAGTGATLSARLVTTNVVVGDDVRLVDRLVGTFASADVGVHPVAGDIELAGQQAGNYAVDPQPEGTAEITLRTVTLLSGAASDKTYDGSAEATATGSLSGVRAADTSTLGYEAAFDGANVGEDLPITVSLMGPEAGNYALVDPALTAAITARPITVTVADLDAKTYGDVLELGVAHEGFSVDDLIDGESIDQVTLASTGAGAQVPVDTYDVDASAPNGNGFDPANYLVSYAPGKLSVQPRAITIAAATTTWTYGEVPAAGDLDPVDVHEQLPTFASFGGALERTDIDVGDTATFDRGTLDIVDGDAASIWTNFDVTFAAYTIEARSSTITIDDLADKTYGDALALGTTGVGFAVTNLADGETVTSVDLASDAEAADAVVGPYDVAGSNPVGSGGFDPANYDLTWLDGATNVVARELTISGTFSVVQKEYDGTTSAEIVDPTTLDLLNTVEGDDVALLPVATFDDPAVGADKAVQLGSATGLAGADAGNYLLSLPGAPGSIGTIVKAQISFDVTIAGTGGAKTVVYDGGTFQPNVVSSVEPVPSTDPVAFVLDMRYEDIDGPSKSSFRDVGTYWITVTADDPRYEGASIIEDVEVLARELVLEPTVAARIFGDADPSLAPLVATDSPFGLGSDDAFSTGDHLSYPGAGDPLLDVGSYPVDLGAVTIVRADADVTSNYAIAFATDFDVMPREVIITPDAEQAKTYGDDDPTFGYAAANLMGDDVVTGAVGRDAGEDVGGYAFTLGDLSAGGNYELVLVSDPAAFLVEARPLTLTAATTEMVYGDEGHDLTASVATGTLLGGEAVTGALALSGTDVGPHDFLAGDAVLMRDDADVTSNYALSYASYEITARPATVTPDAEQGKTYGDDDPILTFTTENLVGEDALGGELGRDAGEDVGSYAFALGTLADPNYELKLVADAPSFAIAPRPLELRAAVDEKEFSDPDPDLSPVVASGSLREGDVLAGSLAHEGVNVGTYPLSRGSVAVERDAANVTANYALTFGTFTIVAKPVTFDIADSDFVIDDGTASAHVFESDGSSEIRGLEVDSDPAGVDSFVFSYRRTHDENHDPVPSGQQTVQNINLLGSYVVTVTATDPNYYGSTPIDVWVTDATEVAFTDASADEAVLGFDALLTIELRNAAGDARSVGTVALQVALDVAGTGSATFRDAADTEDIVSVGLGSGASSVDVRIVPTESGTMTVTAISSTDPVGALGSGSHPFTALEPTLTALDDGPYDVVEGGSREIPISELLANDEWTGASAWGFDVIESTEGVRAQVVGDDIVVSADPDTGNTTGTVTYRIASDGPYGKTATATVAIDVTLAPIEALLFADALEFEDFISSEYAPPTSEEVLATWPVFEGATVYDNVASAGASTYAKDWAYDAESDSIVQPGNASPPTGFISEEALDYFEFEATLASSNGDNDAIGLVVAYDLPTNSYLVAVRGQNGAPYAPASGWGLWYYANGSLTKILDDVAAGPTYGAWTGYESRVSVRRTGDTVRLRTTAFAPAGTTFVESDYLASSEITIDLGSGTVERNDGGAASPRSYLDRFVGAKSYGYWTYSQPDSKYLDVMFAGGVARDTAILLTDPVSGEDAWTGSEVWRYDADASGGAGAWTEDVAATIQSELGSPRKVTSVAEPAAGSSYDTYAVNGTSFQIEADRTVSITP